MDPFAPRPDRDAYATIRGFVYQVDLTILRWLDLRAGQVLELESGEDIDLVADALNTNPFPLERLLEQVKYRERNVTLRSASVLEAIANALKHRDENVGHDLALRYSTNACIGREQSPPAGTPPGTGLLELWEKLRRGEDAGVPRAGCLSLIRAFITGLQRPKNFKQSDWQRLQDFFTSADENSLTDLVSHVEWATGGPVAASMQPQIERRLREFGKAADAAQAIQQYERLFLRVFKLLCQSGRKAITPEALAEQLAIPTLSAVDRALLVQVTDRVQMLEIRLGSVEQTVQSLGDAVAELARGEQHDAAIRVGIVEPLDFTVASHLSQERFLLGVDTTPSHVAANLDLERPAEEAAIALGIKEDGYVVLVGPSGSGKSALLWRSARNCDWVAAKARILRLTDADVPELVRWVRLQQPGPQAPLLLCADNLGRGSTSGWAAAVRQLRGITGVVLLGAARCEDFQSELVASSPRVVEPTLTEPFSGTIAATLRSRGVTVAIDPAEAYARSGGLLMEFLYLLLAGRRMRDVVTAQVHERLGADRATEREALRYVCSAHRLGLAVPAETLDELLKRPSDLPAALLRLRHEHLLAENENTEWVGLHELRSEIVCDVLRVLPPPTEDRTYAVLLAALPASSKPVLLQRYGYLSQAPVSTLTDTTLDLLKRPDTTAEVAASLIDALRQCETVRYARQCIEVAQRMPGQEAVSISARLTFAILMREKGFKMPSRGPSLEALAAALPERPSSEVRRVLGNVGPERLVAFARDASPTDAVRLLAALEGYVEFSAADANEIWSAHSTAPLKLRLAVLTSLSQIATLSAVQIEQLAGPMDHRLGELVRQHPNGILAGINRQSDEGVVATGEILVPAEAGQAHSQAVSLAQDILDLLPEADIAEVITREPAGRQYLLNGHPHNYKRIPRENLPRPTQTRPQREVLDAVIRLLAARFWSDRLRLEAQMAEQATALLNQLPSRLLNRYDNARRRSAWQEQVQNFSKLQLPSPPVTDLNRNTPDGAQHGYWAIQQVLSRLATEQPSTAMWIGTASQLWNAMADLQAVARETRPALPSVGEPLPSSLFESLHHASELLFALGTDPTRGQFRDKGGAANWLEVARNMVSETRTSVIAEERAALLDVFAKAGVEPELTLVPFEDPKRVQLVTDQWAVWLEPQNLTSSEELLSLPDQLRLRLAFRVFVIPIEGQVALPFAAQRLGGEQFFPASSEQVQACCTTAGKMPLVSPHLPAFREFCDQVVEASRLASLYWLQPTDWRNEKVLHDAKLFLERARDVATRLPDGEIRDFADRIIGVVEAELQECGRPLAAAFFNLPPEAPDDAVLTQFNAVSLAVALAEASTTQP